MAVSTIAYPESTYRWFLSEDGNNLALVQNNSVSGANEFQSPDQSVEDGVLLSYYAIPDELVDLSDVPEIDESLHMGLVYFCRWKLSEEQPGEQALLDSKKWESAYNRQLKIFAKRDKISGTRSILMPNLI